MHAPKFASPNSAPGCPALFEISSQARPVLPLFAAHSHCSQEREVVDLPHPDSKGLEKPMVELKV
jgi:hypothetical protein